jgi:phosphate:Na+ symporter
LHLTIEVAIPILLGDNIGTCVTALLSSIGTNHTARRTAVVHLLFNVFGSVIFMVLRTPFTWVVTAISPAGDIARQIANAHTMFNVLNTVVWLPGAGFLENVATRLVPGEDIIEEAGPKYLDRRMLGTPGIALDLANQETVRMASIVQSMLARSRKALTEGYTSQIGAELASKEELVDSLNRQVVLYLSDVVAKTSVNESQSMRLAGLMHAVGDVERIGDVAEQLMDSAREKYDNRVGFSDTAIQELHEVFDLADSILERGIEALRDGSARAADEVYVIHRRLDEATDMLRANHILRLNEGTCVSPAGVIFVESMNSLERVGDLAVNLADAVMGKKSPRVDGKTRDRWEDNV